jgi:hypothetical protein
MKSICPKCKKALAPDAICCAEVHYTWRCRKCFKLAAGFALPYGKCPACGGELQMIPCGDPADSPHLRAIRQAVQLELDSFHFFKLARDQARDWEQRAVLERLYEAELKILYQLDQKFHTHLEQRVVELSLDEQNRMAHRLFRGICLSEHSGVRELYSAALEMERHTRDQLRRMEATLPLGGGQQLCKELASEEEEHVAILESELAQISAEGKAPVAAHGF